MASTTVCSSVASRLKVFTPAQVEQFVEEGWVILPQAFERDAAAAVRDIVWRKTGKNQHDPMTWSEKFIHIAETLKGPQIERCISERVTAGFDDLAGEGRWLRPSGLGWWPVIFPGFDKAPWMPPTRGWHVDGSNFHHHLTSPEQGLLAIFVFSDIGPGDGGTAFDVGSHKIAARELAESEPAGLNPKDICLRVNRHGIKNPRQVVANAGDLAILHPFMNHSVSANVGNRVRFMCNAQISLREPMCVDRPAMEDHSPVERAIVRALAER